MEDTLLNMKPTRDYLVCVDSDGCVFDNMELKHKECFCPTTINVWGAAERIALRPGGCGVCQPVFQDPGNEPLSRSGAHTGATGCPQRGPRAGLCLSRPDSVEKWIEETDSLSAIGIKEYASAHGGDMDPVLATAARWSAEVDENIERIVHGVTPLPDVKDAFAEISRFADIVIVSATPHEAIVREWSAQGLLEYITVVAGQELGTKKDCIHKSMESRYAANHVLMVGDAPGDHDAAQSNGVLFDPIIPSQEVESWSRLRSEASKKFRDGSYAGNYMSSILAQFDSVLRDEPNW